MCGAASYATRSITARPSPLSILDIVRLGSLLLSARLSGQNSAGSLLACGSTTFSTYILFMLVFYIFFASSVYRYCDNDITRYSIHANCQSSRVNIFMYLSASIFNKITKDLKRTVYKNVQKYILHMRLCVHGIEEYCRFIYDIPNMYTNTCI